MESSPKRSLTDIQKAVLEAFFAREKDFYLTGGAALVGFHLGHRETDDLDFFTNDEGAFERGSHALVDAVASLRATAVVRQEAPGFRRYFVERDGQGVVVDLVLDRVAQVHSEKEDRSGIRVDPADEIFANKLTALVSRAEVRDLVDVMALERTGYSLDQALKWALAKDAGCTPGTLAWVLSEIHVGESAELLADIDPIELAAYLNDLVKRLRRLAVPNGR